jgi:signal transduction protein with GAF and PtsI domain
MTKTQLKEYISKIVRQQLNESYPGEGVPFGGGKWEAWGSDADASTADGAEIQLLRAERQIRMAAEALEMAELDFRDDPSKKNAARVADAQELFDVWRRKVSDARKAVEAFW